MATVSARFYSSIFDTISNTSCERGLVLAMRCSVFFAALPAFGLQHLPAAEGGEEPGGDLRVEGVDLEHPVGDEVVAPAIGPVEIHRIARGEGCRSARAPCWGS